MFSIYSSIKINKISSKYRDEGGFIKSLEGFYLFFIFNGGYEHTKCIICARNDIISSPPPSENTAILERWLPLSQARPRDWQKNESPYFTQAHGNFRCVAFLNPDHF